jgi:lambda family phage portal protein
MPAFHGETADVPTKANWMDRALAVVAPRTATKRVVARAAFDAVARKYDGAALGRLRDGMARTSTSADAEIARALPLLRARHRDLVRNNPHARKACTVWKNNLIGAGIIVRSNSPDQALNEKTDALWNEWVAQADADGQLDFYGLQELATGIMIEGGEALIRRRVRKDSDGLAVPLQLQILEGDHLDHSKSGPTANGRKVVQGVEFDAIGRRAAYWLFRDHPGNAWLSASARLQSDPVPASEVLHLYRKERTQTRGVPWGAAVITDLHDEADYDLSERTRKKIEACVVAIVTGADEDDEGLAPAKVTDAEGNTIEKFEPGLIAYAHAGKDVKFNSPQAVGGYVDYKKVRHHVIAAGYLIPHMLMTGELSEVNFTSSRVGLVDFRRLVDAIQWLNIIPMALMPVRAWFCEAAYLAGKLPVPYVPCKCSPPGFESVNPMDDANADLIRMRSGTLTWDDAVAGTGRDPDQVMKEIVERNKKFDDAGLVLDSDPRKVTKGGNEQPSQSQQATEGLNPRSRFKTVA